MKTTTVNVTFYHVPGKGWCCTLGSGNRHATQSTSGFWFFDTPSKAFAHMEKLAWIRTMKNMFLDENAGAIVGLMRKHSVESEMSEKNKFTKKLAQPSCPNTASGKSKPTTKEKHV